MSKLSAIVIAKNEQNSLEQCLKSLNFVDEIVVLDSGSTDHTLEIAKKYTSKVYQNTDWQGFGVQKSRALAYATGVWVLSIDADEWVSKDLAMEIMQAISVNIDVNGYMLPRVSSYCGKWIKFGHWRGDSILRLFKRSCGKFTDDLVHERLLVTGKIAKLKHNLYHRGFTSHEQVLSKMDSYSSANAQLKLSQGCTANIWQAVGHGAWTFINSYLLRLGFLDGSHGFMLAVSAAEGSYYKYIKLMLLNKQKQKQKQKQEQEQQQQQNESTCEQKY